MNTYGLILAVAILAAGGGSLRAGDVFTGEGKLSLAAHAETLRLPAAAPERVQQQDKSRASRGSFQVDRVSIKMDSRPVRVNELEVTLMCRFEGMSEKRHEKNLPYKISETAPGVYALDIAAGSVSTWALGKDLSACSYTLSVKTSDGSWGLINLAGSTWGMQDSELDALIGDQDLAARISAKYQPLRLRTKNLVVSGDNTPE
jgi:hypothetical protein